MGWYKTAFGEDYLQIYAHRDKSEAQVHVRFALKELGLAPGRTVLDVGCGFGRHAVELSGYGLNVYCMDLSDVLIKKARDFTDSAYIHPVRADMRYIPFKPQIDTVFNFFTSFGYFETDAENVGVLHQFSTALKSGGYLFLDYFNFQRIIATLVTQDKKKINGMTVVQKRWFNKKNCRIEKDIFVQKNGTVQKYHESVRAYTLGELEKYFSDTGLQCVATFGDYDGSDYTPMSPRLLMIGKKVG